ncbi:MAG TPA: GIY-YIG nuclease family protein, partial [Flavobacteriaceae bacterium]|nr:GIY-YIG nuclease family protein [Flavobacteriaceae bacterium]
MTIGYMYILECSDGSYYTGSTKDLNLRLEQHQNGFGALHTAKKLPVKLVYYEEFQRIDEAFYREKQVQGWSRKKKKALLENNYNDLKRFAICQNETNSDNWGFDSAQPPKGIDNNSDFSSAQPPKGIDNNSDFSSAQPLKGIDNNSDFSSSQPPKGIDNNSDFISAQPLKG